jgi:hypothetical protein
MDSESRLPRVAPPIAVERRTRRLSIPPCPNCAAPPRVVSRTDYVLYVRCAQCAYVWCIEKPGWSMANARDRQTLQARAEQARETSRSLREQSREILKSSFRQLGAIIFGKDSGTTRTLNPPYSRRLNSSGDSAAGVTARLRDLFESAVTTWIRR